MVLMISLDLLSFRRSSLHFREMVSVSRVCQGCFIIFYNSNDKTGHELSTSPSTDPLELQLSILTRL